MSAIEQLGREVLPLQMDLRDLTQVLQAMGAVMEHFGRFDLLVNNTGVAPTNLALDVNEADFDRGR